MGRRSGLILMLSLTLGLAQAQRTVKELLSAAYLGDRAALQELIGMGQAGNAKVQDELGFIYYNGIGMVPKDLVMAASWWRKAAEQGDAGAQFRLALRYAKGEGVPKDSATAASWFRKAAEQGEASVVRLK